MSSRLSDYDFILPPELIAQRPAEKRDESRMLVLRRADQSITHSRFSELRTFIEPGDLLVLNDTRVVRARRFSDDGAVELLLLERLDAKRWLCLVKPGRKMRLGASIQLNGATARVEEIRPDGERIIALDRELDLHEGGVLPLPPYVERPSDADDEERYQTVFARKEGAIAAPTAGLHFTPQLLRGLPHTFVTLHVGVGTFRPVQTDDVALHQMHSEQFVVPPAAASAINAAKRVLAVGTTTVRVLESARRDNGQLVAQKSATDIFIRPPDSIRHVDMLLTNFHLPRSTLLMLVSAFASREFILRAYAEAIRERYRFYSYGDCMLIL